MEHRFCCPARSIPTSLPATLTVGGHQPLNNFGDLLREEISRAGYTEMLTHGLCSRDENFKVLCLDRDVSYGGTRSLPPIDSYLPSIRPSVLVHDSTVQMLPAIGNTVKYFRGGHAAITASTDHISGFGTAHTASTRSFLGSCTKDNAWRCPCTRAVLYR